MSYPLLLSNSKLRTCQISLKIKGQPGEDAVLCTSSTTYSMRSVVLSNTVLVVTSPADNGPSSFSEETVVISDQVKEIIELVPAVPKLHKLTSLLRGRVYDENDEMMESQDGPEESVRFPCHKTTSRLELTDSGFYIRRRPQTNTSQ